MRTALLLAFVALLIGRMPAHAQDAAHWPHTVTSPNGATVVVYQPQAISWPDQKTLAARMALAITPPGSKTPILGTIELSFATATDNATHLVTLTDPKLTSSHFPSLDTAQAQQVNDRIAAALPTLQLKQVPFDAIVLSLKELPQTVQPVAVNNDPPTIFHADSPASLVVFDGDPVLAPAGNSGTQVRRQYQLGRVLRSRRQWHLVSAEQRHLAGGTCRHRHLQAGKPAAGRLREAAVRRQLRRRPQRDTRQAGRRGSGPQHLRQHRASRDHRHRRTRSSSPQFPGPACNT